MLFRLCYSGLKGQFIPAQGKQQGIFRPKAECSLSGALGRMRCVFNALKGQVNRSGCKPVQLLDIYPTLLELTGLKADPKHEGNSLVPLLTKPEADWSHMARTSFGPGNYAIISEHYRYIHYNDGSEEFYDHRKDPHEWNNLIENPDYSDIVKQHRAQLPSDNHRILGEGSTGHLSYEATEADIK